MDLSGGHTFQARTHRRLLAVQRRLGTRRTQANTARASRSCLTCRKTAVIYNTRRAGCQSVYPKISGAGEASFAVAASTGRIVCVGCAGDCVELHTSLIVRKELEVLGSRNGVAEFGAVIRMRKERRPFTDMISRIVAFEQVSGVSRSGAARRKATRRYWFDSQSHESSGGGPW